MASIWFSILPTPAPSLSLNLNLNLPPLKYPSMVVLNQSKKTTKIFSSPPIDNGYLAYCFKTDLELFIAEGLCMEIELREFLDEQWVTAMDALEQDLKAHTGKDDHEEYHNEKKERWEKKCRGRKIDIEKKKKRTEKFLKKWGETMGGGNAQKSKMAPERNTKKMKGNKGSQLDSNKDMSIQDFCTSQDSNSGNSSKLDKPKTNSTHEDE